MINFLDQFISKKLFNITRNVAVVKSDKDTRYGLSSIVTHDGAKMACLALSELSTFRDQYGPEAYDKVYSLNYGLFFGFCTHPVLSFIFGVVVVGCNRN